MGEEKKEEAKKEGRVREEEKKKEEVKKDGEEKKEEVKKDGEEKKEEEEAEEIVLKVDMHCEACARKVARALKGFPGVEGVAADCKAGRVVVKGKTADPIKVCQRIQKKSGRKVELISPLPKPPAEENKEEVNKQEPPKQDKKDEPPPVITVVLKVRMHCDACAHGLQKRIRKIEGVESVATDVANDKVTVQVVGVDPEKLASDVYKKTGKQASVVKPEEKKEEEGEEKKKQEAEEKKDDNKAEEKKAAAADGDEEDKNTTADIKKSEYWAPRYYLEYAYAYPPQIFSDENPNACSLM